MINPEYKIINYEDIPDGGGIVVDIYPEERLVSVIVTRRGQKIAAFNNICTHAGWRLENDEGRLLFDNAGDLICSGHCAIFDACEGTYLGGPGKGKSLKHYPLVFEGKTVIIR
jgi:nitrite reductase/ring-hydroxylating ferredoxin subunit